jgi:hypothetical protein
MDTNTSRLQLSQHVIGRYLVAFHRLIYWLLVVAVVVDTTPVVAVVVAVMPRKLD